MKVQGVYVIRNTISGRVYVGSAQSIKARWAVHRHQLAHGRHHSKLLQLSWTKHGPEAFSFEIVETVPNASDLTAREQYWIDALSAFDPSWERGFNGHPTAGSPLGHKASPEARAAMSASRKGRKVSPETLAKIAPSRNEGRKRWIAKIRSDPDAAREHSAKLSAAFTGKTKSPEHRAKIRLGNLGKVVSPETRAKQAEAQKTRYARDIANSTPRFGKRSPQ
jgi:group I intron endonuclease